LGSCQGFDVDGFASFGSTYGYQPSWTTMLLNIIMLNQASYWHIQAASHLAGLQGKVQPNI